MALTTGLPQEARQVRPRGNLTGGVLAVPTSPVTDAEFERVVPPLLKLLGKQWRRTEGAWRGVCGAQSLCDVVTERAKDRLMRRETIGAAFLVYHDRVAELNLESVLTPENARAVMAFIRHLAASSPAQGAAVVGWLRGPRVSFQGEEAFGAVAEWRHGMPCCGRRIRVGRHDDRSVRYFREGLNGGGAFRLAPPFDNVLCRR
jgi:hypothetical protein